MGFARSSSPIGKHSRIEAIAHTPDEKLSALFKDNVSVDMLFECMVESILFFQNSPYLIYSLIALRFCWIFDYYSVAIYDFYYGEQI